MEIKKIYDNYGMPRELVDGTPMPLDDASHFSRLPVVQTGQGFANDGTVPKKTTAGASRDESFEGPQQFVEDSDGSWSFNPGGF